MTTKRSAAGASPGGREPDADRILQDIDRHFSDPIRSFDLLDPDASIDYQVKQIRDGRVDLVFSLPLGMTKSFMTFLSTMHEFMRVVERQSRMKLAEHKAVDPVEIEQRRLETEAFKGKVLSLFDQLFEQGMDRHEAIKATNQALKRQNHPWANHEVVLMIVRASGRLNSKNQKGGYSQKI
ncbi:MAG: hypothetical protein C0623_02225 [Desulfuromonas sp.]|nr:MAG: hypothetical protein C0623_02225 [Desulfuromonas sp.]